MLWPKRRGRRAMNAVVAELERAVGADRVASGEQAAEQAFSPWTRPGKPVAVGRRGWTGGVAAPLGGARGGGPRGGPGGGAPGLVDGCNAGGAIALSREGMNAMEEIAPPASTMTVQAGCVLATACDA